MLAHSSSGGLGRASKQFLLPAENFWDVASAAFSGIWAYVSDPTAKDDLKRFISDQVIKDAVLGQAKHGSMLTMALFHNLRNPLFAKHKFEAVEFIDGVAPALETYQDTLGRLVHIMNKSLAEKTEDDAKKDEETLDVFGNLAGENVWRKQAKDDPDSLAARLSKMVPDKSFDDLFFGAKLFHALKTGTGNTAEYVAGSAVVGQIALLNARVMEIELTNRYEEEHPEFAASDESKDNQVAARMDVLYEFTLTYRYRTTPDPMSASEQYKSIGHATVAAAPSSEPETAEATEVVKSAPVEEEAKTITETTLAVAVLEGWLHGGPDKDLRWRVAMVRDAFEFS